MDEVLKLREQLNLIIHKIQAIAPAEVRQDLDSHMAPMMIAGDQHLLRPILRHYPELEQLLNDEA